jgi:LAO/AO transport system kinase
VMELADLVVINKVDIDADAAMRAQAQITSSLRLLGMHGNPNDPHSDKHWQPKVLSLSALLGKGVDTFWAAVSEFQTLQTANGLFSQRRQNQSLAWMWERIDAGLKQAFKTNAGVRELLPAMTTAVLSGQLAASTAARNLLMAHVFPAPIAPK